MTFEEFDKICEECKSKLHPENLSSEGGCCVANTHCPVMRIQKEGIGPEEVERQIEKNSRSFQ